ncbi:MAG: hypothetical protein QOJ46_2827 [bacterium]|jgi:hypothetical protein
MRQRDPLTPEEERELDALERALAGEPVDADLRDLEDLVNDIRATAPQMSPGFAASLEHRVSEGFPATDEHPAPRSPRRWMLFPAAGALCAALVGVVVVLGANGTGRDDAGLAARQTTPAASNATKDSSGSAAEDFSATAPSRPPRAASPAGSSGTAAAPAGSSGTAAAPGASSSTGVAPAPSLDKRGPVVPGDAPRKVQRSAELVLRVPSSEFESTSDGVIRTVDRFGGIVANSTSASDDSSGGEATFELRIPTGRLDDALAALSKLGHVAQRSQDLVDITSSFTSAEERLSDARAERRGLLKALGRASTKRQIDSLRARLRDVRSQIARLNGALEALRRRADLSTVSVTVRGGGAQVDPGAGSGASWSPGDAARDAVRVLEVIAGVLLIALAILAPLGMLALLGAFGVRATRRRRREAALDPA